jgi:hypothetical protein
LLAFIPRYFACFILVNLTFNSKARERWIYAKYQRRRFCPDYVPCSSPTDIPFPMPLPITNIHAHNRSHRRSRSQTAPEQPKARPVLLSPQLPTIPPISSPPPPLQRSYSRQSLPSPIIPFSFDSVQEPQPPQHSKLSSPPSPSHATLISPQQSPRRLSPRSQSSPNPSRSPSPSPTPPAPLSSNSISTPIPIPTASQAPTPTSSPAQSPTPSPTSGLPPLPPRQQAKEKDSPMPGAYTQTIKLQTTNHLCRIS